jgi:hypothetical protein
MLQLALSMAGESCKSFASASLSCDTGCLDCGKEAQYAQSLPQTFREGIQWTLLLF